MISEELIERGSILISKFMGAKVIATYPDHLLLDYLVDESYLINKNDDRKQYPDNSRYHGSNFLKYHKEFNWIMPVLKKVTLICDKETYDNIHSNLFNIEKLFELVSEFLDWLLNCNTTLQTV